MPLTTVNRGISLNLLRRLPPTSGTRQGFDVELLWLSVLLWKCTTLPSRPNERS